MTTAIQTLVPDNPDAAASPPAPGVNQVRLVGRVSAISEPHLLPSGDSVITLRLVVPRPVHRPKQPSVDTIDIACWSPESQQGAVEAGVGGGVEVAGSLRRRFFRGAGGLQSRYEVEAHLVRRAPELDALPGDPQVTSDQ